MNYQRVASVVRQVLAIAAIVMGALTAALSSIKLPTGFSAVLAAGGAVILAVEHYVSDPTTGNNVGAAVAQVAAAPTAFPQPTAAPTHPGPVNEQGFPVP